MNLRIISFMFKGYVLCLTWSFRSFIGREAFRFLKAAILLEAEALGPESEGPRGSQPPQRHLLCSLVHTGGLLCRPASPWVCSSAVSALVRAHEAWLSEASAFEQRLLQNSLQTER